MEYDVKEYSAKLEQEFKKARTIINENTALKEQLEQEELELQEMQQAV